MPFRRRALRTAAVVGGTAYVAGKAGAKAGAANAQAAAQQAPAEAARPPDAASTAEAPPTAQSAGDKMDQLTKLKQLLDMGALTPEEFDTQKARILASM